MRQVLLGCAGPLRVGLMVCPAAVNESKKSENATCSFSVSAGMPQGVVFIICGPARMASRSGAAVIERILKAASLASAMAVQAKRAPRDSSIFFSASCDKLATAQSRGTSAGNISVMEIHV